MTKKIKLNSSIGIDLPKLIESRAVVLANSGGGKSWVIRRIAEQAVEKIQTIILDPEGEFSSLRERYDFILAGKDADVPAEPRSAAMLATKLLELGTSAVVDLYEMHPQERQRFVKLFCEALVNCPKSLYHPVLIILDEAHDYVPEGKPSEATYAVEALASKGRKRGQCLILASQRISKLSKNAAAECNNKLIGRASQDIDMKRAGDELGFTKDKLFALRQLKPGEFFAFGPAISDEVQKVQVGEVQTTHAKVGYKQMSTIPAASAGIKKVLSALKDLPKEAEKEAKTAAELRKENTQLKRDLNAEKQRKVNMGKTVIDLDHTTKSVAHAVRETDRQWKIKLVEANKEIERLSKVVGIVARAVGTKTLSVRKIAPAIVSIAEVGVSPVTPAASTQPEARRHKVPAFSLELPTSAMDAVVGKGETLVLKAIAQHEDGIPREHITLLTGYKRSTRDRYIQYLQQKVYVRAALGRIQITQQGLDVLGNDYEPLPTGEALREHLLRTLPEGEKKILAVLIEANGEFVDRDELTERTLYQRSTRDRYIQYLQVRELVESTRDGVKASAKLYE